MLRQGQTCNVVLESAAFEQLHHDELLLVVLADLVHHTDVRMIERRGSTRFAQESLEPAPGPGGGTELNFRDYWGYNIAGYRIAKLLGIDDMVPVYTERSWNGTKGAISWRVADVQFDEADRYNQKIQPPDPDTWAKQMYKLRVMTQLFYDMDANLTNVLITKDWKIWRIDFSRGFRLQHDLKDPKDLVQCDRQVLSKLRQLSYDQVFDATKPYLSKDEVKALIARRDKMVAYFH